MTRKENSIIFGIFFFVTCIFFYKFIFHGFIPFPGDLLINEYSPWKSYSYLGYNPGSYPSKAQYFDVLRQMYPWKSLVISLIKNGQVPLWNPYNFSGSPLLANFQSAVFYPLNFFYFLLNQQYAWGVLVFLQPLLSGFFTFLFARKLKVSTIGSLFSGFSFAFCSFNIVWLEYNLIGQVILWLPLTLLAIEYLLEKRRSLWVIVFFFSVIAAGFGGHPQIFFYEFIFFILYLLHRINTVKNQKYSKIKQFFFFLLILIISLGLLAVQYIPGLELISYAARSSHEYTTLMQKILIQPWQFIMFLVPDFFGNPATRNYWPLDTYIGKMFAIGVVMFIFSLFSLTQIKNALIRFFLGTAIIIFMLTTANPITYFLYSFQIPFFSSSAPTLSIFLFCFSLSILTGIGIDVFIKSEKKEKLLLWFFVPIIFFASIFVICLLEPKLHLLQGTDHAKLAIRNSLLPVSLLIVSFLGLIAVRFNKKWIYGVLVFLLVLQLGDTFRFFNKFNPFVPQELVFPKAQVVTFLQKNSLINRVWSFGGASFEANIQTQENIYSPEGYDPLYPKWYGEFIQSSNNGKIETAFTDKTRSDAVISPASSFDFQSNSYRLKILNLLGVSYIADVYSNGSNEKTFPVTQYQKIYDDSLWKVYKNDQAMPRIFLTSSYETYNSSDDFSNKFFNNSFDIHTILLPEKLSVPLENGDASVQINSYLPNKVSLHTHSSARQLLFLSDTYYPGWEAFIDGKPTKIYRADYAFRAIIVPSGSHSIIFTFNPASFKIGLITSIFSLLIAVGIILQVQFAQKYVKK